MIKDMRSVLYGFYDEMLAIRESFNIISACLAVFLVIQTFELQFLPIILNIPTKSVYVEQAFNVLILFRGESDKSNIMWIYPLYIVNSIFYLLNFYFIWLYSHGEKPKGIFFYIRLLIPLCPYLIFNFPLIGHAALLANSYMNHIYDPYTVIYMLIDMFFFLCNFLGLHIFTPIMAATPLYGSVLIPSRFIPDDFFLIAYLQEYVMFFITFTTQYDFTTYFFSVVQIFNNIWKIAVLRKLPFSNIYHTNAYMALSVTIVTVQILEIIVMEGGYKYSEALNIITAAYYLIVYAIILAYNYYNANYVSNIIQEENIPLLENKDPQLVLQMAFYKEVLSNKLLKYITKRSEGQTRVFMRVFSRQISLEKLYDAIDMMDLVHGYIYHRICMKGIKNIRQRNDPKYDSDIFWKDIIEGNINKVMLDTFEKSKKARFKLNVAYDPDDYTKKNVRKLLNKTESTSNRILFYVLIFSVFSFGTLLMIPNFILFVSVDKAVQLPDILDSSLNIGYYWSDIMLAISNAVNCTVFNNITLKQIKIGLKMHVSDPSYLVPYSIGDFFENLTGIANYVREMADKSRYLKNIDLDNMVNDIRVFWNSPILKVYQGTSANATSIDIMSILNFHIGNIFLYEEPDTPINQRCSAKIVKYYRSEINNFMNVSIQILDSYYTYIEKYQYYIERIKKRFNFHTDYKVIIPSFIIAIIGLYSLYYWYTEKFKDIFKLLSNEFRIYCHPTMPYVEFNEYSQEMKGTILINRVIIISTFVTIAYILICYGFNEGASSAFHEMMKLDEISVKIENASLSMTSAVHEYFRTYQFPNNDIFAGFKKHLGELIDNVIAFHQAFSPLNYPKFSNNDNLPTLIRSNATDHMVESFHDVYSYWPVSLHMELYTFLLKTVNLSNPQNPDSMFYLHLSHLYLDHLYNELLITQRELSSMVKFRSKDFNSILITSLVIYFCYIFGNAIFIYNKFLLFEKCKKILHYHLLRLDPEFISTQSCLMSYLIENQEKNIDSINSIYLLLCSANIPIILTENNGTIVSFTRPITKLFGLRVDQIMGQPLKMIIPEDNRRFFYNLQLKIASTHSVQALTSTNESFTVEIRISPFLNNSMLLEVHEINELMNYEELIQVHKDLYYEYSCSSYPFALFSQSNMTADEVYMRSFSNYSVLVMVTDSNMTDETSPISPMKHYFADSIVVSCTCSLWFSVFVGNNSSFRALKCYQEFGFTQSRKGGIILEGDGINVLFFNLPSDICDFYDINQSLNVTPPYLSIEPIIPLNSYLEGINKVRMDRLLCCRSITKFYDEHSYECIDDGLISIRNENIYDTLPGYNQTIGIPSMVSEWSNLILTPQNYMHSAS